MEFEITTKDYEGDPLPNTSSHHRVYNYMKYMKQNIYMRYAQNARIYQDFRTNILNNGLTSWKCFLFFVISHWQIKYSKSFTAISSCFQTL